MTEHSKNTLTTILHEILVVSNNPLIKAKAAEGIGYIESRPTLRVIDDIPVREGI